MENNRDSTISGSRLPVLPVEIKFEILKHATYEEAHDPAKIYHLCTERLPALADFAPFKNGTPYIPSVTDLIHVHFAAEKEVYSKEYSVHLLTADDRIDGPADELAQNLYLKHIYNKDETYRWYQELIDPSVSDDFRYIFFLSIVSKRAHEILGHIQKVTGLDLHQDYKLMLRLSEMHGPYKWRGFQKAWWPYFQPDREIARLPEPQRGVMKAFVTKINDHYTRSYNEEYKGRLGL